MNISNRRKCHAVLFLGALLCASPLVHAGEIEDANKLFKQGQRSEALEKVNAYLAGNPKDAQARFLKGLILTEQGKTADAIKIFSSLTDDYPDLPEPYNNLAVLYAGQGQYDKAKMLLEMAISTHPSYATAHENLGDIYAKMASQAYDRALQLDHGNATTQTKLAMIQNLFADNSRIPPARNAPVQNSAENNNAVKTTAPAAIAERKPEPVSPAIAAPSPKPESVASSPKAALPPKNIDTKKDRKEVVQTITAWAAAWSAKNPAKYLAFYSKDFKAPNGETRAAWEAARKERISKPKFIHVDIRNLTAHFTDNEHATVKFRQIYRASHLKTTSNKTLSLVKSGNKWLIREEHS